MQMKYKTGLKVYYFSKPLIITLFNNGPVFKLLIFN